MHISSNLVALCGALLVTLVSFKAFAQSDPFAHGFKGALSINAGYSQSQSQHNTHDDNAITQDLSNRGKKVSQISPMLLGRLQYGFGNTVVFLGNSEEQIAEANFQVELGVSQKFGKYSSVTGALFGNVPGQGEVWRDPYLTEVARSVTDQSVSGVRFAYSFDGPLPFSLKYAHARSEVDKEEIGLSQPLTDEQRSLLTRDSQYHRLGTELALPVGGAVMIAPAVYYTLRDAKGNAHSLQEIASQVAVMFNLSRHSITTTVRSSIADFEADNPLFKRKQDYQSIGLFSVYRYHELFNLPNTGINVMAGYQKTDSDIEFYSHEDVFLSTGVSYHF